MSSVDELIDRRRGLKVRDTLGFMMSMIESSSWMRAIMRI
jgi:hypothetical protein